MDYRCMCVHASTHADYSGFVFLIILFYPELYEEKKSHLKISPYPILAFLSVRVY